MAKILVVEDEGIVSLDIENRLIRMGHDVTGIADSSDSALELVRRETPDLVLMDIHIHGDVDGIETAARLRREVDVPVVFLTAYSDEKTMQRAKATAPFAYVLKPFKDRELNSTIEIALYRHSIEKEMLAAREELEVRVNERTAELAQVNEQLRKEIAEHQRDNQAKILLEEQLRQSQKMEVLGQLAGGIAHDFNNMLTIIKGYSELVLSTISQEEPFFGDIKAIHDAGERAAALTSKLLTFGRRQPLESTTFDVNSAIRAAQDMLQRVIGEHVVIDVQLHPTSLFVHADSSFFDQILVNLSVNARDAMPQGGQISIRTEQCTIDAPLTNRFVHLDPGSYVLLIIGDTGTGMDDATLNRIFEPFFTTKGRGKGTGLGLAMVYSVVTQSGGQIDVLSKANEGTTFTIYLPLSEATPPDELVYTDAPSANGEKKNGTIMVVEDEDIVRSLARRVLGDYGFDVLEASRGDEALALAELHTGAIDLLLTDVVMPEMNGPQLVQHMIKQRPAIRTIYMSGFTNSELLRHGVEGDDIAFLQKPFSPQGLIDQVNATLSA